MKKLTIAIAVSSALISGASFAGNVDNVIFQNADNNIVEVTQNTTGADPADGHLASETIIYGDDNSIIVTQTGKRNTSTTEINGANHENSDHNTLVVDQDGDDNNSSITLASDADGNTAIVNIYGSSFLGSSDNNTTTSTFGHGADDNQLMIDIEKGSDNTVNTSVADNSNRNYADVGMHYALHNTVTIAQNGDDNMSNVHIAASAYNEVGIDQNGNRNEANVDISFFSFVNNVDIAQTGNDNTAGVDIALSSFNDVDIEQTGHDAVANVYVYGSAFNTVDVTQTNNDSSTVTVNYSHNNSAIVVQN